MMPQTQGAGAAIDHTAALTHDVVVRVQIVYNPGCHYTEVCNYVWDLSKHGEGEDGGPAEYFTSEGETVAVQAFLARLWKGVPWVFKVIPSPAVERSDGLPMQEYAQAWMQMVEGDLGCHLDWLGAVHFDTDVGHAQCIWSGCTRAGELVKIDREYVSHGLRAKASELAPSFAGMSAIPVILNLAVTGWDLSRVSWVAWGLSAWLFTMSAMGFWEAITDCDRPAHELGRPDHTWM
jgi:hypothetical protein